MNYYMTSKSNSEIGYWAGCKAHTLTGAKRERTRMYGDGYLDSTLQIATGDDVTEQRQVVASKSNAPEARWSFEAGCPDSVTVEALAI